MKKFILDHKTKILLTLFFTFLLMLLNSDVFAFTFSGFTFEENTYHFDAPLVLQTETNSYIIAFNPEELTICVYEPYNPNDYLVALSSGSTSEGTYNRIYGYDVSENTLADSIKYVITYNEETNSWGQWYSSSVTYSSIVAPR